MRGTVVVVVADHARSIVAVVRELAVAARELADEGVELDVLLVETATGASGVAIATTACSDLGLPYEVVRTDGMTAWTTQRDAFSYALTHTEPHFLVTLDPAGHHDARQLPELVRSFRSTGAGLTIGSRWARGGLAPGTPWLRSVLSRLASFLVAHATGLRRIRDVTTSFRVIRADTAELVAAAPATTGEYGFYCEFVAAAQAYGFTVSELPITFRPRFSTVAPLRWSDLTEFWADLRRLRRRIRAIRSEMAIDQAVWAARSGRMREQTPTIGSAFGALDELTELSEARRFTRWIVDGFAHVLGSTVLEVGAGMGAIAREIAGRDPTRSVTAIEPAANVFGDLVERSAGVANLEVRQVTSDAVAAAGERFDTIVYVNVLEHIHEDVAELRTAHGLLVPGGSVAVFVPAMPGLYGSLDFKSGHYRRYEADQLRARLHDAGFVDIDVRYVDVLGVAPYWFMYRLLDVSSLGRVSAGGYDRVIVPISRSVERVLPRPPFGKNLIATGRRPG